MCHQKIQVIPRHIKIESRKGHPYETMIDCVTRTRREYLNRVKEAERQTSIK